MPCPKMSSWFAPHEAMAGGEMNVPLWASHAVDVGLHDEPFHD
jgi:hypothetical protein